MTDPVTPPDVTELPDAPERGNRATFRSVAEVFVAALSPFRDQLVALGANIFSNAESAYGYALSALGYRNDAETAKMSAETAETNAEASAQTAVNAPGTNATSTTELTISSGEQILTIQIDKDIVVGMSIKVAYTTSPTTWMHGTVTGYVQGTGVLTVNIDTLVGSGTYSAWTISLSAPNALSLEQIQASVLSF